MTNVIQELRQLEEARRRGEIEESRVAEMRAELLGLVEDAEVFDGAIEQPVSPAPSNKKKKASRKGKRKTATSEKPRRSETLCKVAPDPDTDDDSDEPTEFVLTLWHITGLIAVGLVAFTGLMAWLFDDLSMGITLGIAALAVVIIRAAQILEEQDANDASPRLDTDDKPAPQ